MKNPLINILILNWNNKKILLDCIKSIKKSTYKNYKITVIDNGSKDGSIDYINSFYDDLCFISISSNLGFSSGYNYAFEQLQKDDSEWFLLLNNDTEIMSNTIQVFANNISKYGNNYIYGCKIMNINNNKIWYAGGKINKLTGSAYHVGANLSDELTQFKKGFTDFVSGCCMLIKKDLIYKINGFNEKFNFYYEDVDLCNRAKTKNVKCFYISDTSISHYISYSLGGRLSINKILKKIFSFIKYLFLNHNIFLFIYYLAINVILLPVYIINFSLKIIFKKI